MFKKSELRHACFRAKNEVATEKNKSLLQHIEPLLESNQVWNNFVDVWDLLVSRKGEIVIIKPEMDYEFIHTTCLEASILTKRGDELDFDDRKTNIINIVDANMLTGLMTWESYSDRWCVFVDHDLKQLQTKMLKQDAGQTEVTQDMINDSIAELIVEEAPTVINLPEPTPMSAEEIEQFRTFLKTQTSQEESK